MYALYTPRALTRLMAAFALTIALISLLAWGASHASAGANPASENAAPAVDTFVVNSTLDEPNPDPSTGVCDSTPSHKCTLRAAVMVADFVSGPSTIKLPSGVFQLTRSGYDDAALVGDLDIQKDVTIQGTGSSATIIDGNGGTTHDRVFQVLSTAQNVTLSGITIRHGESRSNPGGAIGGGGLYIEGKGDIQLSDVILDSNTALNGGGIYADFSTQGGSLTLDKVVVHANTATVGGVGAGGGVYAYLPAAFSQLTIQDSRVYSNTTDGTGGGLYVNGNTAGQWSITRSEIYSNTAVAGGAIGNFAPLTLSDSRLHNNSASSDGGAIEAFAPIIILRTTLDANTAGRFGGGLFDIQDGGTVQEFAHIEASTLSGNAAQYGGAIYHDGYPTPSSLLMLLNSTLNGNVAFRRNGVTGTSDGGGIYVYGGQVQLLNATIAYNVANPGFSLQSHVARGAGVFITDTAQLTIANTIIGKNTENNGITLATADDCFSYGSTGTLAYDLIFSMTNCSVTGSQGGNIVGQDPLLGPLQNNGGPTQTQALQSGSPAIDAGAPAGCTNDTGAGLTTDQRGGPRPINGRCDIGAFEYGSTPPTATPTSTNTPTLTATRTGTATATATRTHTFTPTATHTRTFTPTATRTHTSNPTATRTHTPGATQTLTPNPSETPCGLPAAPTLLKPKNNQSVSKAKVKLKWSAMACATQYQVVVRAESKKGAKVAGKTVTANHYKTAALPAGTTYYWQVKACSGNLCSKSKWFEFERTP